MERQNQPVSLGKLLLLTLSVILLSGCSAHKTQKIDHIKPLENTSQESTDTPGALDLEAEFAESSTVTPFDPLSGYNRFMTRVNDRVYVWALKPVAQGYSVIVPEPARLAADRFFRNLLMPVRFVNNLLQLKPKRAATELARFAINSTGGILGFTDPAATSFNLQAYPEDFGQTLGYYGIGSGFHIVLPLLGPSNLRDTIGLVPDHFLDPVVYVDEWEVRTALRAHNIVNKTSLRLGEYESIKKDAVDLYLFLRDAYEQRRDKMIEE